MKSWFQKGKQHIYNIQYIQHKIYTTDIQHTVYTTDIQHIYNSVRSARSL